MGGDQVFRTLFRSLLATTVLFVGLTVAAPAVGAKAATRAAEPTAVVAIIDTGINPYHVVFRDDSARAYKHPSTYIPGYPKDAQALRLSFGEKKYWDAVKKDCERVWSKIELGKLYWFPGTKIVGGITFQDPGDIPCDAPEPRAGGRILDAGGHGTMTASRATSVEYGACKECLVVAVQFPTSLPLLAPSGTTQPAIDAIQWAASNADWIDAQSNSWGPFTPVWDPTGQAGLFAANPEIVRAVEEVSQKHLAFWASGNGALFRFGIVGHPTLLTPHLGPSAVIVGGHDSGYVTTWPGFPPHVVSDACASWAAYHTEMRKSAENVGAGTSAATPFVAGGAVRILLEARRALGDEHTGIVNGIVAQGPNGLVKEGPLADGEFTMEEWKETLFKTASPRPQAIHEDGPTCPLDADTGLYTPTPIRWSDVPPGYPEYLHIGYGAVDSEAVKLAFDVLLGKIGLPDRAATDQYFALDRQARQATYEIFSTP